MSRHKERPVNHDRIEGAMKTTGGKIKEAAGKLVGDASLETEGKVDQVEGKVQNTVGGIKDAINRKD
jgi:uncharacterized protein YjbJ (UPF0337 family)